MRRNSKKIGSAFLGIEKQLIKIFLIKWLDGYEEREKLLNLFTVHFIENKNENLF